MTWEGGAPLLLRNASNDALEPQHILMTKVYRTTALNQYIATMGFCCSAVVQPSSCLRIICWTLSSLMSRLRRSRKNNFAKSFHWSCPHALDTRPATQAGRTMIGLKWDISIAALSLPLAPFQPPTMLVTMVAYAYQIWWTPLAGYCDVVHVFRSYSSAGFIHAWRTRIDDYDKSYGSSNELR